MKAVEKRPESPLTKGDRMWAYLVSVGVTTGAYASALAIAARDQYMGGPMAMFAILLTAPFIALMSLAWTPLGRRYAAALEADPDRQWPSGRLLANVLSIAGAAGTAVGLFFGPSLWVGIAAGAGVALGGLGYLASCWWSMRT